MIAARFAFVCSKSMAVGNDVFYVALLQRHIDKTNPQISKSSPPKWVARNSLQLSSFTHGLVQQTEPLACVSYLDSPSEAPRVCCGSKAPDVLRLLSERS